MIRIGRPYVCVDEKTAFLKAKVEVSNDTSQEYIRISKVVKKVHWRTAEDYPPCAWKGEDHGLWFSVSAEYKDYLCVERSDAFVVAMLWYAMITGSDIEYTAPISESMAVQISHLLIPALCRQKEGRRQIRLLGPTTNIPYPNAGAVGTGMSCGVDSLYSLHQYSNTSVPMHHRLTHLTYFNMGAIFHPDRAVKKKYDLKGFYEKTDEMSEEKRDNARHVADIAGLPLVYVKSNLDQDFYRGAYGHTGVYRNCAMTLALQGLFSVYYCSSAGWPDYFHLSLTEGSEQYEGLLTQCLSTESLHFILSDYATRIEKTKTIADDMVAQKYLDVCFRFNNCGQCSKCLRTLLTLDILDRVDLFDSVFNLSEFKKNRVSAYAWLLKTKDGKKTDDDVQFALDIYRLALEKGKIPPESERLYRKQKRHRAIKKIVKFILPNM